MVGAKAGRGDQVSHGQLTFEIPKMHAGIVMLSLDGPVLDEGRPWRRAISPPGRGAAIGRAVPLGQM